MPDQPISDYVPYLFWSLVALFFVVMIVTAVKKKPSAVATDNKLPSFYPPEDIAVIKKVFPEHTELHTAAEDGDVDFVEDRIPQVYREMLSGFNPALALELLEAKKLNELRVILGQLAAAQAAAEDFGDPEKAFESLN